MTMALGVALVVVLTIAVLSLLNLLSFGLSLEVFAQWVERLAPFFQILASLGVLGGLITAFLGFRRYLTEKEREHDQQNRDYLSTLRQSIYISRPILTELNSLLKYELFYEMVLSVSNFKPIDIVLDKAYALGKQVGNYSSLSFDTDDHYLSMYTFQLRYDPDVFNKLQGAFTVKLSGASLQEDYWNPYQPSDQEVKSYLIVPIRTKLVELFESHTKKLGSEIEPYRFDYPSLSRVLLSANHLFTTLEKEYKRYARETDHWTRVIADAVWASDFSSSPELGSHAERDTSELASPEGQSRVRSHIDFERTSQEQLSEEELRTRMTQIKDRIVQDVQDVTDRVLGLDEFKDRVTQGIVRDWYQYKFSQDAEAIDAMLGIVDIVTRTYLSKTDKDLVEIGKRERKMEFAPLEQTPRPEQMLQEAYEGLKPVLLEYDRSTYHDLVQQIARSSARKIKKEDS
jgi:hypothetical protein